MTMIRNSARAAAAALVLLSAPALAKSPAEPQDAQPCETAMALSLLGPTMKAADNFLTCAQVPGQKPFKIVQSRFRRLQQLEAMKMRELAEAELVALTSPPLSTLPVFTNSASGNVILDGEESIGQTQVDLLAARAGYRLVAKDLPAALTFANKAIALAGYDPALLLDAAPAFAYRSRMAYADKNTEVAVKMAVRAYVRGSEDGFVQEIIQSQDAGTQERLKQLRKYLQSEMGGYPYAITAHARVTQKAEDIARQIKDAKTAAASLEQFERAQLGPL